MRCIARGATRAASAPKWFERRLDCRRTFLYVISSFLSVNSLLSFMPFFPLIYPFSEMILSPLFCAQHGFCGGKGMCVSDTNHEARCSCDPGFTPPNCTEVVRQLTTTLAPAADDYVSGPELAIGLLGNSL